MSPPADRPLTAAERLAVRGGAIELLRAPAALFGALVVARRAAYDLGLARGARLDVPVVSIGNLTAGGTGKTPACAWLAHELARRGFRPGILSRGYGAAAGEENDESRLLARLLPGVPRVADPRRARGGALLVARGATALVLDDGFQHRQLARDLDLVLVDATRPWGLPARDGRRPVRALLPRGLLREPPSSLARADALVVTRSDQVDPARLAELERELAGLAPGRPLARAVHAPRALLDERGAEHDPATLSGVEIDAVSALGNPAGFEATLRALGAVVVEHRVFPDHHRFALPELAGLGARRPLVASGKDAVKLAPLGVPHRVLDVEFRLVAGAGPIEALLDALPRTAPAGLGAAAGAPTARRSL
ncbi:MAG: tetraacyldisaccharide 4'-kinase [Planctomycetes bacterium]|nr:tetraacyldisaccharide 4'-kinase [Planctomycetota bacterium]